MGTDYDALRRSEPDEEATESVEELNVIRLSPTSHRPWRRVGRFRGCGIAIRHYSHPVTHARGR